mmetsp:Transcript_52283/g.93777  ORF Transcript_52283/g.93777 Transcript_52283/m.93777 type:complete len:246 (+) Transcript_52283:103-840(+)
MAEQARHEEVLLEQDFAKLEEAIEAGLWEVDGEGLSLYATGDGSEVESDPGPPGAVIVTEGSEGLAELVHRIRGAEGAEVSRLTAAIRCEVIDDKSAFTVGLAFDDDLEEAALLALTLRRPRPETKMPEPGAPPFPEEDTSVRPVMLQLNGKACGLAGEAVEVLGASIDLDLELHWGQKDERKVVLHHRLLMPNAEKTELSVISEGSTTSGFYTTDVKFNMAKVLFLRATGAVKVRLSSLRMEGR